MSKKKSLRHCAELSLFRIGQASGLYEIEGFMRPRMRPDVRLTLRWSGSADIVSLIDPMRLSKIEMTMIAMILAIVTAMKKTIPTHSHRALMAVPI